MISAESQLVFLAKIQRLFAEGDFTATYKFALLIVLADLAVELGGDDEIPLTLNHRSIGEKFIELYWQQAAPFKNGFLAQNHGKQAAIISAIHKFRQDHPFVCVRPTHIDSQMQMTAIGGHFVLISHNKIKNYLCNPKPPQMWYHLRHDNLQKVHF